MIGLGSDKNMKRSEVITHVSHISKILKTTTAGVDRASWHLVQIKHKRKERAMLLHDLDGYQMILMVTTHLFLLLLLDFIFQERVKESQNFAVSSQSQNTVFFTAVVQIHTHNITSQRKRRETFKTLHTRQITL